MEHLNGEALETKCVHAGMSKDQFGAVVPPIYQTSTFKFESAEHGAALFGGTEKGYIYTRMTNPTVEALENAVAALEGGYKALGCASGMAAVNLVFSAMLKAGDHVVCSAAVYGPTSTLLNGIFKKFGVEASMVNTNVLSEVEAAIKKNTTMIYIETPGNPTMAITDIAAVCKLAKKHGAKVVVDNTFMSPILQQPLALGADVVLHSMTKFLNGHADVVAGIVVVKDEETYAPFRKTLNQIGGVIDPFNSFLTHRGIKTLALRMKRHCENAQVIAEYLEKHPMIKWVKYPGLKSHPEYELGQRQHKGPGGMISFEIEGGFKAGQKLMNSVKLCQLAVSLGGVETLIQHPASMTHFSMGAEGRANAGISEGLVRFSVGIEEVEDIIKDLEQAMQAAKKA